MKVKEKLLVVETEGKAEDYNLNLKPITIKKQLNTSVNVNLILSILCADLDSETRIDNDPILKNFTEELKKFKRNYPHCAQLIQANKDSTALLQYNEDIQLLDKELDNIKKVGDNYTFNALQYLKQHVLEKSIVQHILFPSNRDIVLDTLQEVYAVPVREIYNKIELTSATTFAAETS
ncbi:hypothetical protein [Candidatus Mesenet endosymbiont of Agriotes lineatus]|uniref:hypothetical protein n=1 Tax=Candidatus Mesenet endosymbiont of Agriotes lineatus TaxID=3077948 RepID=UPI0030D2683B